MSVVFLLALPAALTHDGLRSISCASGSPRCRPGCMVPVAMNYDPLANEHDGSCSYPKLRCPHHEGPHIFNSMAITDESSLCGKVVHGCTHKWAVNYDANATVDDGSCRHGRAGCTREGAPNYDALADVDDGSCDQPRVGCMTPLASNYDPAANVDSGRCVYAVAGCTDSRALNFNPLATRPLVPCIMPGIGCMARRATNFNSTATMHLPAACMYTPTAASREGRRGCMLPGAINYDPLAEVHAGGCEFARAKGVRGHLMAPPRRGCTNPASSNFEPLASVDDGSCRPLSVCVDAARAAAKAVSNVAEWTQTADAELQATLADEDTLATLFVQAASVLGANTTSALSSASWCAAGIAYSRHVDGSARPGSAEPALSIRRKLSARQLGVCNNGLDYISHAVGRTVSCGCMNTKALNYDRFASVDDGNCRVQGCMDSLALNYDEEANIAGLCTAHRIGCLVPWADNYDSLATKDTYESSVCIFLKRGCTDRTAVNFAWYAQVDDGSCQAKLPGCKDPTAVNYVAAATVATECSYGDTGCTDSRSPNFAPLATADDGSCSPLIRGCTIRGTATYISTNFNPNAQVYEPNSCVFAHVGCRDPTAVNYNSRATVDAACVKAVKGCTDPQADTFDSRANVLEASACVYPIHGCKDSAAPNFDPVVSHSDGSCAYPGCTDSIARNYDRSANFDDGSCILPTRGCTDSRADNFWEMAERDDGSCVIPGCMHSAHPDFSPFATVHSGCRAVPAGCTDSAASNFVPVAEMNDGSCRYGGCKDSAASNYDATATFHAGGCEYLVGCTDSRGDNYQPWAKKDGGTCVFLGCTDPLNPRYSSIAMIDDGSCAWRRGCTDSSADNFWSAAAIDDGSCLFLGCTDSRSPRYNKHANRYDGSCPPILGCTNSAAENYAHTAWIDDGTCVIMGCMNSASSHYNPGATDNDGSCPSIPGCRDPAAENYVALANTDGGECVRRGCADSKANNFDRDANTHTYESCDFPRKGCTNSIAPNFQPRATIDDGTCYILGCTKAWSSYFNPVATANDGTCGPTPYGCTDSLADNYQSGALEGDPALTCIYVGCTDSHARNYFKLAHYEGGLCAYWPPPAPPSPPEPPAPPSPPTPSAPPPRPFSDGTIASSALIGPASEALSQVLSAYDGFASSVCTLDMNGDKVGDLVVGAETTTGTSSAVSAGAVYFLILSATGAVDKVTQVSTGVGGFKAPLRSFDNFGSAVAHVGDLNGDGYPEIAVGARGDDNENGNRAGAVYILFTRSASADSSRLEVGSYTKIVEPSVAYDMFGTSLAAPGDLDGDGVPDLVVGAPANNAPSHTSGSIHIVSLTPSGTMGESHKITPSSWDAPHPIWAGSQFGAAIATFPPGYGQAGTVGAAVGAPGAGAGAVVLLTLSGIHRGSRRELQPVPVTWGGTLVAPPDAANDASFGHAVSVASDYDGNGAPELVVGAPGLSPSSAGAAYLLFMDSGRRRAYRTVKITAADAFGPNVTGSVTQFGRAVTSMGALNLDDIVSDLAIGARYDSVTPRMQRTGLVSVLFMTANSNVQPMPPSAPPPMPPPVPPLSPLLAPPSAPPFQPVGGGGGSLSFESQESYLQLWLLFVLIIPIVIISWAVYYKCQQHDFVDLVKTSYLGGPFESVTSACREGRVAPSLRLEIRGAEAANRARRVRGTAPGTERSVPVAEAATGYPPPGAATEQPGVLLDTDVLLNVCYAPNVPRAAEPGEIASLATQGVLAQRAPSTLGSPEPVVVDLSLATESLLRGPSDDADTAAYNPQYRRNSPRQQEYALPGGLWSVQEDHEREQTWGENTAQQASCQGTAVSGSGASAAASGTSTGAAPASAATTGPATLLRV